VEAATRRLIRPRTAQPKEPVMPQTYTDRHPDGSYIRFDQAQPGDLIGERHGNDGDLRIGIVTEARGHGAFVEGTDGQRRFVRHGCMFGVARPT
jgi:hypothetical protein